MQLQDFPPFDTKTTFQGYFQSLKRSEKKPFRDFIIEKTYASYPTFYEWMRKNTWPELVKVRISEIIGRDVDQLFPN